MYFFNTIQCLLNYNIERIITDPKDLSTVLDYELNDVSLKTKERISNTLKRNRNYNSNEYRDLIFIKKRITESGRQKIINVNVSEKLIPKEEFGNEFINKNDEPISKDFGVRAFLIGLILLLSGLVFTTSLKLYQKMIKEKYIKRKIVDK